MKKLVALTCLCAQLAILGCGAGRAAPPRGAIAVQNEEVYDLYRQYMEALNKQRQQAGLPPQPVRSYEAFRRAPSAD